MPEPEGSPSRHRGVVVESATGPAARAGLRAGDCLVAVGGERLVDVLDLEFAAADGELSLEAVRDGRRFRVDLALAPGEDHGIGLQDWLGAGMRSCVNDCRFCFVDQMPPGLRPSLYVKDDDYRLSFLEGNFVTLSNMTEKDLARVERLRLSPLYVSLHAWDDEARAALMGAPATASRAKLQRLLAAGIRAHIQIVLCPGWNDGPVLEQTLAALASLDGIQDVGVVPVSLAREGALRRVSADDAARALDIVERARRRLRADLGREFVHAADELYLQLGRMPPSSDAEMQYENGVGMAAAFLAEAAATARRERRGATCPPLALLTGTLAEPVIAAACATLGGAVTARPFPVYNGLFGAHVTVTGLLGGADVLAALRASPLGSDEWLAAPRAFLPAALGRTLDGCSEAELREACDGRLALGDGLADAVRAASG